MLCCKIPMYPQCVDIYQYNYYITSENAKANGLDYFYCGEMSCVNHILQRIAH